MKKRSLFIGVAMLMGLSLAVFFSGCESPTDGASGNNGANGPATFTTGVVDAAALAAVYEYTGTVVLANGVSSVDGLIPADKKLIVAGGTSVTAGESLTVEGALEIVLDARLDASYISGSAGYLTGSGSVNGEGGVLLPYIASDATGAPDDIITYTSAIEVSKAVGSYIETDASTPATSALGNNDVIALFTLDGEAAINELTVADITGLTAAAVPSGKTLRLASGTNTTIGLDLSAATAGTLIVAAGATLEVTTSITGQTGETSNITINGVIKLASNATALSVTNVDIAAATIDASAAGDATLTLPTGTATVKSIIVGNSNDLTIAGATGLKLSSIKSGATTKGVKSASVLKYSTSDADYVGLGTAAATFIVTKLEGNVFSIATDSSAVSIGSALTIAGDAKLKTEGTGGISVAVAYLAPTSANFAKFASGSTITYSDAVAGPVGAALVIPEGITVNLAAVDSTLSNILGLTVNGTLNLGANTGLTLTLIISPVGAVSTGEKGVIKSAITDAAKFVLLLSKAGDSLAIQQTGAVALTAATTVKAGTTLTIGASGKVTADNAAAKKLTVAGTIVLDGGSLETGTTAFTDAPAITISGTGSIVAGGIVISGAGSIYDATASTAKAITIEKDEFAGAVEGAITLTGAAKISAADDQVVLSVDGGAAADKGTFTSAATNGQLTVSVADEAATIALDDGTAVASALTIGDKGSLAVGSGGTIAIKAVTDTLVSDGSTAKLSIAQGAKLKVDTSASGTDAAFAKASGVFSGSGTFAAAGQFTASSGFWN